jgi:uncharacterized protein
MPENTKPNKRRLNARDPLVLDTRDLGHGPGHMRVVQRRVLAPAGLGLDVVRVPEGAPLELDLRMESVTEGVLITGTVTGPTVGECGRCLDPISTDVVAEICELFAYPDSLTDETADPDEILRLESDFIDLVPVVRDAVVLGLPVTPLCRPDCAGLCPDCGLRLDDLDPGHAHDMIDPRWAVLADRGSGEAQSSKHTSTSSSAEPTT